MDCKILRLTKDNFDFPNGKTINVTSEPMAILFGDENDVDYQTFLKHFSKFSGMYILATFTQQLSLRCEIYFNNKLEQIIPISLMNNQCICMKSFEDDMNDIFTKITLKKLTENNNIYDSIVSNNLLNQYVNCKDSNDLLNLVHKSLGSSDVEKLDHEQILKPFLPILERGLNLINNPNNNEYSLTDYFKDISKKIYEIQPKTSSDYLDDAKIKKLVETVDKQFEQFQNKN